MPSHRIKCCVAGCEAVDVHQHRFPNPATELDRFIIWLDILGSEDLREMDPAKVYNNKRICSSHFLPKYFSSGNPRLHRNAVPTMDMSESTILPAFQSSEPGSSTLCDQVSGNRANKETTPGSTTDKNMEGDMHSAPSTCYKICVSVKKDNNLDVDAQRLPSISYDVSMLVERDNNPVVAGTTSSASGPAKKPSKGHGLLQQMKVRRVVDLTPKAKFLYNHAKTMERKYVCKSKIVKRLSACFKEAACSNSLETVEQVVGTLQPTTRRFLLQQLREQRKNKHGRRFTLDEKIIALSLLKRLRGAYKLMKKYVTMPSVPTLRRVLTRIPFRPGVNVALNTHLRSVHATLERKEDYCILLFDEVAVQPHLSFNEGEDVIWGFENCGTVQRSAFAEHALVFMLRGFYRRWKQPYAFMFVGSSTKTADLVSYIKEVLRSVLSTNLKVVATICDQNATNIAAINALKQETQVYCDRAGLVFRPESFIFEGREIVHLYDSAHLLKGMRNNLLTKDLDFTLDNTQYRASWQDIVDLYKYDCTGTVARCPSLNDFNVLPHKICKTSVKNCAPVFSRTVYAGMQNLLDERSPEVHGLRQTAFGTAKLIDFMDKLFDSVSGIRNPDKQLRELRRPLSDGSKHIEFWNKARQILYTMKFVKRSGTSGPGGRVPSLTNWVVTLNGFLYLWKSLKHVGFKSLDVGAFNLDPLDNFVDSIRSHLGANRNPTCASFVSSFRTLCVDNQSEVANCEEDDDVALTNLRSFLSEDVSGLSISSSTSHETVVLDHTYQQRWDTASTAYVSGYVARKLVKLDGVSTCTTCKSKLLTTETLPQHSFIADMELTENGLTRPNTYFMKLCTTVMDTTLRLLPLHGHKSGIMKLIKGYIHEHQVVPSLSCGIHDVTNAFVDLTVKLTIYFWTKNVNKLLTDDHVERIAVERYRKSLKRRI